jgi:hypothetical protein
MSPLNAGSTSCYQIRAATEANAAIKWQCIMQILLALLAVPTLGDFVLLLLPLSLPGCTRGCVGGAAVVVFSVNSVAAGGAAVVFSVNSSAVVFSSVTLG